MTSIYLSYLSNTFTVLYSKEEKAKYDDYDLFKD